MARIEHSIDFGQGVNYSTTAEKEPLTVQRSSAVWLKPKSFCLTLVACCLASMSQGWEQVANGNSGWPDDFDTSVDHRDPRKRDGTLKFAIAQAVPWFSASILGSFLSAPLSEYTGLRIALFTIAMCSFTSSVWGSQVTSWEALIGSRILLGIGIGGKASIVSIFESEVLPSSKNGYLLVNWQVSNAVGTILGSIVCYILRNNWRLQILSGVIPGFALLMATLVSCESPRWLMIQGKHRKAFATLLKLCQERRLALKELLTIHYQIQAERALSLRQSTRSTLDPGNNPTHQRMERDSWCDQFNSMIFVERVRKAAFATVIVMFSQQLSGYVCHASQCLQ